MNDSHVAPHDEYDHLRESATSAADDDCPGCGRAWGHAPYCPEAGAPHPDPVALAHLASVMHDLDALADRRRFENDYTMRPDALGPISRPEDDDTPDPEVCLAPVRPDCERRAWGNGYCMAHQGYAVENAASSPAAAHADAGCRRGRVCRLGMDVPYCDGYAPRGLPRWPR